MSDDTHQKVEEIIHGKHELKARSVSGKTRIVGYWDDLSPEPRRGEVRDQLEEAQRELKQEGFDVTSVNSRYGEAYIRITDYPPED